MYLFLCYVVKYFSREGKLYAMNRMSHIMSEIARLRIENAELRKNILLRKMHSEAVEPEIQDAKAAVLFSDDRGFEQASSSDYGMNTKAEKAGFMSPSMKRFYSQPRWIAKKFFDE